MGKEKLGKEKKALIEKLIKEGVLKNELIIEAFKAIPREEFLLKAFVSKAYADVALPIHAQQTISQPTTIAIMLEALELEPGLKVLEVGTGSGYNAALLSRIVGPKGKVYTIEIVPELVEFAKKNLAKLKIRNVEVVLGDGSKGYPKEAPYDRIICAAAALKMPSAFVEQLKEGGIVIAPIGTRSLQHLIKGRKINGKLVTEELGEFVFVPLKLEENKN